MTAPSSTPVERSSASFVRRLADFGDDVAITSQTESLTYAQLSDRVDSAAATLGSQRRLIVQVAQNTVDALVWYLAALASGNPLILIPDGDASDVDRIASAYDPDLIIDSQAQLRVIRAQSAHDLHPDLALMLSTSGSTGSPKLVRLSHRNLESNAASIATYLQIRPTDRAATSLPMGYCYGLSVINSHLHSGAGLVLTDLSVVDECFWTLFKRTASTTFAAVPYTFDLLERVGFAQLDLPHLRYVTQAGGRLAPERVKEFAQLGLRNGWDLFVMYGQTEATARMAYLPPDLACEYPSAIGHAIPGGQLSLRPVEDVADPDVGELVYRGDNVMLGYANCASDLALGATITELRTGDLARQNDAGLFEVVGRRAQFAKLFGKRIDLPQLEQTMAIEGIQATCFASTPGDGSNACVERIVAAITTNGVPNLASTTRAAVATAARVPTSAVQILELDELPRLATGKIDLQQLRKLAAIAQVAENTGPTHTAPTHTGPDHGGASLPHSRQLARESAPELPGPEQRIAALINAYASTLNRTGVCASDSFVTLHGDSMSYIELSVLVERVLGFLPANWHVLSINELAGHGSTANASEPRRTRRNRWTQQIETNVLLRALAVFLVVGSHVTLFDLRGGAHLLIGIAGYNFARFHLSNPEQISRLRAMATSIRRIIVPSMLWMALAVLLDSQYSFANVFFVHNFAMPDAENPAWRYWFVEALVYVLVFSVAVLAVPALHRAERRWPFGFVLAVLAVGLVFRYGLIETATGPKAIYTPTMVLFVFALGWAIAKASTWPQRLLVLALIAATLPGYSENPTRVFVVIGGLALLALVPTVRVPSLVGRIAAGVAGASLYIYLTHWQVYPLFGEAKILALVGSMIFGAGLWFVVARASNRFAAATSARSAVWRMPQSAGFVTSRVIVAWWKIAMCLPIRPTPRSGDSCANKRWSLRPSS